MNAKCRSSFDRGESQIGSLQDHKKLKEHESAMCMKTEKINKENVKRK